MPKLNIESAFQKLLAYCQANDWAGHDPYDALNSRLFAALPLLNRRLPRLVLTQAVKRSPLNLRGLLLTPRTQNPKALALFLSALLKVSRDALTPPAGIVEHLIERLIALRSKGFNHWCWGYSFPWQTRTVVVPVGAPNLVCTVFVADALLDMYEHSLSPRYLFMAVSAAEYLLRELYWEEGSTRAGFSYPLPSVRNQVHNANFLAAALLCRLYKHTHDETLLEPALRVARYSAGRQEADGSWKYGEGASQQWIDNFHTGYNLCALRSIGDSLQTEEFEPGVKRGFDFYRTHFLLPDGKVRYFHNRTYPIDIHCVAQSILTLLAFEDLAPQNTSMAHSVLGWAMDHMWDERGFFYYRVNRFQTIRTSYMRWSQAWMLLAMAALLARTNKNKPHSRTPVAEPVTVADRIPAISTLHP